MTSSTSYTWLCALSALLTLAAFLAAAILRNGGAFEYPLDDVYIHLAMAEGIAAGTYGVNPGEVASAASSPIWPLLLTPFAGSEVQRWLPLVWNVLALAVAAALFGKVLDEARLGRAGAFFAVLAPFALAMYVTAYSGMENMAHGAASLAVVLGLWTYVETGRIGWMLVLGVLLAPAFRLEGLALVLVAGGLVMRLGRVPAGLALTLIGLAPVLGFAAFLMSQGMAPLPTSVTAKLDGLPDDHLMAAFRYNTGTYGGRFLFALSLTLALVALSFWNRDRRRAYFGIGVSAAGLAHLTFGATGWLDRYETYAVLATAAALMLIIADRARNLKIALIGLAFLGGVLTYAPYIPNRLVNMSAIHRQQAEMARFATGFVDGPIAVNDLGYVAWNNDNHVLDLWGLASAPALKARFDDAPPGWADALADEKGVRLAMIYDHWVAAALGSGWVRLGRLVTEDVGGAFLGGAEVAFYARDADTGAALEPELRAWAEGLPEGARFDFAGEAGE